MCREWAEVQYFNSHTREGVTSYGDYSHRWRSYFNSHTREGVTRSFPLFLMKVHFNSHTREGVTFLRRGSCCRLKNFNSHTREGVTASLDDITEKDKDFNSHTREGVTVGSHIALCHSSFQLTHP